MWRTNHLFSSSHNVRENPWCWIKVALAVWQVPNRSQLPDRFLELSEKIELKYGLNHPIIESKWAKKHPDLKTSYLFVDLTTDNARQVIGYAQRGSFRYILCTSSAWSNSSGSHLINDENYKVNKDLDPRDFPGLSALQHVARCVHDALLSSDPDIVSSDGPRDKNLKLGLHTRTWRVIKNDPVYIGHECLLSLGEGTGEESGLFIPDPNCSLIDEFAQRFAQIYNAIGADMVNVS